MIQYLEKLCGRHSPNLVYLNHSLGSASPFTRVYVCSDNLQRETIEGRCRSGQWSQARMFNTPTLFNLYACMVVERWKERIQDVDDVGVLLNYKMDRKLFRRYTRNASQAQLTEGQFADDAAPLATSHRGAEIAITEFSGAASDFGLKVSFTKTKMMAAGREVSAEDQTSLRVGSEEVEYVKEFPYLNWISRCLIW